MIELLLDFQLHLMTNHFRHLADLDAHWARTWTLHSWIWAIVVKIRKMSLDRRDNLLRLVVQDFQIFSRFQREDRGALDVLLQPYDVEEPTEVEKPVVALTEYDDGSAVRVRERPGPDNAGCRDVFSHTLGFLFKGTASYKTLKENTEMIELVYDFQLHLLYQDFLRLREANYFRAHFIPVLQIRDVIIIRTTFCIMMSSVATSFFYRACRIWFKIECPEHDVGQFPFVLMSGME